MQQLFADGYGKQAHRANAAYSAGINASDRRDNRGVGEDFDVAKRHKQYRSQLKAFKYLLDEQKKTIKQMMARYLEAPEFHSGALTLFRILEQYEKDFNNFKKTQDAYKHFLAVKDSL